MSPCDGNGTSLYYEVAGQGNSALFIHGMCGNGNVWGQVALLSRQLRCVTYDRRGHTRSPLGAIAMRTVELHADDASALIGSLGIAPCVLAASSGGARVGVDLLRRYPELFTAAILSEPPIFRLDPQDGGRQIMQDLQPPLEAALRGGDPGAAIDAFFEYMCPGLWKRLTDAQKDPTAPIPPSCSAISRCPRTRSRRRRSPGSSSRAPSCQARQAILCCVGSQR